MRDKQRLHAKTSERDGDTDDIADGEREWRTNKQMKNESEDRCDEETTTGVSYISISEVSTCVADVHIYVHLVEDTLVKMFKNSNFFMLTGIYQDSQVSYKKLLPKRPT